MRVGPINRGVFMFFHVMGLWTFSFHKIVLYGVNLFAFVSTFEKTPRLYGQLQIKAIIKLNLKNYIYGKFYISL